MNLRESFILYTREAGSEVGLPCGCACAKCLHKDIYEAGTSKRVECVVVHAALPSAHSRRGRRAAAGTSFLVRYSDGVADVEQIRLRLVVRRDDEDRVRHRHRSGDTLGRRLVGVVLPGGLLVGLRLRLRLGLQ